MKKIYLTISFLEKSIVCLPLGYASVIILEHGKEKNFIFGLVVLCTFILSYYLLYFRFIFFKEKYDLISFDKKIYNLRKESLVLGFATYQNVREKLAIIFLMMSLNYYFYINGNILLLNLFSTYIFIVIFYTLTDSYRFKNL